VTFLTQKNRLLATIELVEGEEAEEIERLAENQRSIIEQKMKKKKERREINKKITEKKKTKNHNKNQLGSI